MTFSGRGRWSGRGGWWLVSIHYNKFYFLPGNQDVLAVVAIDQLVFFGFIHRIRAYLNRENGGPNPTLEWVVGPEAGYELVPGSTKMGAELMHPQWGIVQATTSAAVATCDGWARDWAPTTDR